MSRATREKRSHQTMSTIAGCALSLPGILFGLMHGLAPIAIGYPTYFSGRVSAAFLGLFLAAFLGLSLAAIGGGIGFFLGRKIVRDCRHGFREALWATIILTAFAVIICVHIISAISEPMGPLSWCAIVLYMASATLLLAGVVKIIWLAQEGRLASAMQPLGSAVLVALVTLFLAKTMVESPETMPQSSWLLVMPYLTTGAVFLLVWSIGVMWQLRQGLQRSNVIPLTLAALLALGTFLLAQTWVARLG